MTTSTESAKTAKTRTSRVAAAAADAGTTVARFADFQALKGLPTTQAMESIMTKSKDQFEKLSNEAASASKESFEAWMKSGTIFMKGYEDMMKTCVAIATQNAEKNGEAFKSLLACKTVNEYAEVHNRLTQQGFDDFMTGATKLSELAVKLATDGFAPINDQWSKSIKKAGETIAA